MRCIVCGGDHQPKSDLCDPEGMDKEIARLGLKHAWNKDADLKPVEPYEPCPACHGTGWGVSNDDQIRA